MSLWFEVKLGRIVTSQPLSSVKGCDWCIYALLFCGSQNEIISRFVSILKRYLGEILSCLLKIKSQTSCEDWVSLKSGAWNRPKWSVKTAFGTAGCCDPRRYLVHHAIIIISEDSWVTPEPWKSRTRQDYGLLISMTMNLGCCWTQCSFRTLYNWHVL